jgi:hypothetical protein
MVMIVGGQASTSFLPEIADNTPKPATGAICYAS